MMRQGSGWSIQKDSIIVGSGGPGFVQALLLSELFESIESLSLLFVEVPEVAVWVTVIAVGCAALHLLKGGFGSAGGGCHGRQVGAAAQATLLGNRMKRRDGGEEAGRGDSRAVEEEPVVARLQKEGGGKEEEVEDQGLGGGSLRTFFWGSSFFGSFLAGPLLFSFPSIRGLADK